MKNYLLQLKYLLTMVMIHLVAVASAQVTSSSMSGVVKDSEETLIGATVKAVHIPSGTNYSVATNEAGRFYIPAMRVGGPYKVTITYVGYKAKIFDDVYLKLGETYNFNIVLESAGEQLSEVVVSSDAVLNSSRTGASTNVSKRQLETLPTVSRGFNDFVRLTPQADTKGGSISIAGMNNRYNQVTIDGAVSNDVFGLAGTGTNGGSTGTSPISLDAIEQFNIEIAPFDVRKGGFAGGGISAVTRSGTNEVQGSVYYYFRNQDLAGKTPGKLLNPGDKGMKFNDFTDKQYGFRIGGPIIKNKLFFFLNAEQTKRNNPLSFVPGQSTSQITTDELDRIAAVVTSLGYDPGSYLDQEERNESQKLFGRLDWNINSNNKLTARYSYTEGEAVQLSRTDRSLTFANGGVLRESKTNSAVVELNSTLSPSLFNNLIAGYTTVRDPRSAPGAPFPRVLIRLDAQRIVNLGTEAFSTVNLLEQDVATLTDNLTLYKGNHTFTFGTHNEFYKMYNAFIGQAFGDYGFEASPSTDINPATGQPYSAIENFERGLAKNFTYQYSKTDDPREGAKFNALQLGFYAQDEFQMSDNLKLTGGIRLDIPIYTDEPLENTDFNNSILAKQYDVKTNRMPKPALMWSPRVGFNWDIKGDRSSQLRGGLGIFTSRFPFVWAGGAFTQNGILLDKNQLSATANAAPDIPFNPDPNNQPKRTTASGPGGNITVIDENFKLPQIARANIAWDHQLPWGIVGTAEFMYSKNLNSFRFTDLNLKQPVGVLSGADDRLVYDASSAARKVLPQYTQVIYIDNVNEGYSWTATAQLQKNFENGFYGSLAYSFTESKDLFAGTSSQNQSNFFRVPTVNGSNNVQLGFSPFNVGSRIVGAISYRKEYINHLASTISLFYTGQSGTPFSYIVNGDLTRSTSGSSSDQYSLIYIPRDASEITFVQNGDLSPEQQWTEFNSFIESQDYLRERRGKYAERNGARTPFTHQFDLKFVQDIFTNISGKRNSLQLSVDVLNIGNLLNKDWGAKYAWGFEPSYFDNTYKLLTLDSFNGNTPQYKFNPVKNNEPYSISDDPLYGSRWVAQIGLRYNFN